MEAWGPVARCSGGELMLTITCKDGLDSFFVWAIRENLVVVLDQDVLVVNPCVHEPFAQHLVSLPPWLIDAARQAVEDITAMREQRADRVAV